MSCWDLCIWKCKMALSSCTRLSYHDQSKRLSFFVSAPDTRRAFKATKIRSKNIHLLHNEKLQEHLSSLSEKFNDALVRRLTFQNSIQRHGYHWQMHWDAHCFRSLTTLTDPSMLVIIFDSLSLASDFKKALVKKKVLVAVHLHI